LLPAVRDERREPGHQVVNRVCVGIAATLAANVAHGLCQVPGLAGGVGPVGVYRLAALRSWVVFESDL
jgi:hypothetical protein